MVHMLHKSVHNASASFHSVVSIVKKILTISNSIATKVGTIPHSPTNDKTKQTTGHQKDNSFII